MNYLGVPTEFDPNSGNSAGAAFVPTDLDPHNQTRSDARRAYFDPYASRKNFHVITGQHVTRVLIDNVLGSKASDPKAGGNEDGEGSDAESEGLAGFGLPKVTFDGQKNIRRANQGLKVTGVEVITKPFYCTGRLMFMSSRLTLPRLVTPYLQGEK